MLLSLLYELRFMFTIVEISKTTEYLQVPACNSLFFSSINCILCVCVCVCIYVNIIPSFLIVYHIMHKSIKWKYLLYYLLIELTQLACLLYIICNNNDYCFIHFQAVPTLYHSVFFVLFIHIVHSKKNIFLIYFIFYSFALSYWKI